MESGLERSRRGKEKSGPTDLSNFSGFTMASDFFGGLPIRFLPCVPSGTAPIVWFFLHSILPLSWKLTDAPLPGYQVDQSNSVRLKLIKLKEVYVCCQHSFSFLQYLLNDCKIKKFSSTWRAMAAHAVLCGTQTLYTTHPTVDLGSIPSGCIFYKQI